MLTNNMQNVISQDYISEIIAMDAEPIIRNLKITQCYYDLSQAIAYRLGNENVNWCTFATWASKTAGRFIRMEEVNVHLHHALHSSDDYREWLLLVQEKFNELELEHEFGHDTVHRTAQNTISELSADIAAGNLKVFSELGPVFAAMIAAFDKSLKGDKEEIDILLERLEPGDTAAGGQDLLRSAIIDFHSALHEPDPKKKAELMLRANAQTGLHEQIRLQPYIAGAMEAPLHKTIHLALHRHVKDKAPEHVHHLLPFHLDHLFTPIAKKVHDAWLNLSTHYLMTLIFPDGVLHLGKDLPKPQGAPMFPDHLVSPQDPHLTGLLMRYEAHMNTTSHSHARNWAKLEDRMHYILNLFRSRQQHRPLHKTPFEITQEEHIRQNRMPSGKL